jgi:hypothetical protein
MERIKRIIMKNEALTKKQLKTMVGQPVWIESLWGEFVGQWEVVTDKVPKGYGDSWVAYKHERKAG